MSRSLSSDYIQLPGDEGKVRAGPRGQVPSGFRVKGAALYETWSPSSPNTPQVSSRRPALRLGDAKDTVYFGADGSTVRSARSLSRGVADGARWGGGATSGSKVCCCGMGWSEWGILAGSFAVMFTRYCVATFLSAFFADVCDSMGMSETWNGVIMAAYPTGISISSLVASVLIFRMGTRTATFVGLLGTGITTLVFGFVPDMTSSWQVDGSTREGVAARNQIIFLVVYLLGGLCAVAENAVLVVCAIRFKDRVATVISLIGSTAAGLGCMAGPPIGGFLYALGTTDAWKFRIPFLVLSIVPLLLSFVVLATIPQVREQRGDDEAEENMGTTEGGDEDCVAGQTSGIIQTGESCSVMGDDVENPDDSVEGKGVCGRGGGDGGGGGPHWTPAGSQSRSSSLSGQSTASMAPPGGEDHDRPLAGASGQSSGAVETDDSAPQKVAVCQILTLQACVTFVAMGLNGTVVATLDPTLAYRLKAAPFSYDSGMIGLFSSITYVITSVPIGWLVDRYPGSVFVFKFVQGVGLLLLFFTFALLGPISLPFIPRSFSDALNGPPAAIAAMVLKGIGSAGNAAAYPDLMVDIPPGNIALQGFMSGLWNAAYAVGWAAGPLVGGGLYNLFHDEEGGTSGDSLGFESFATVVALGSLAYALVCFLGACCGLRRKERATENGKEGESGHPPGGEELRSPLIMDGVRD